MGTVSVLNCRSFSGLIEKRREVCSLQMGENESHVTHEGAHRNIKL